MEMKLEEAQVCRLCGQCESIYIDVFGEEGTKRFLGLKIHTKINIVIDETDPLPKAICVQCLGKLEFVCDFQEECLRTQEVLRDRYNLPPLSDVISEADGLSHNVCMRCIGTLEFIDDFHRNCHITQQKFIEAKQLKKCPKIKENPPPLVEEDVESDKENASPNIRTGIKRKRQPLNPEKTKAAKPMPLGIKNMNTDDSEKSRADNKINKSLTQKTVQIAIEPCDALKSSPSVTKAKCDSSTKPETTEKKEEELPNSCEDQSNDRKSRTRSSSRNSLIIKRPQSETSSPLNSPKSRPVPVIVKLEKQENLEVSACSTPKSVNEVKSNKHVWMPNEATLPEAEKPKSTRIEKQHDQSPPAGDEAEKSTEKRPEMSSTRSPEKEAASMESVRKSVIETTIKVVQTPEKSEVPRGRETRRSVAVLKKIKADAEEILEDEEEENEGAENRKKFVRISDLISEEQKEAIEKYYKVDMNAVDEEVVGEKIIFLEKKKFGCKICEASFPRQDKCQVHIWGHLDMKPYQCKACEFATVTVSNIRCHIRKSHLKIKPYACELCEKRYVTAFLLEEHMNTHTGSRPYSCTVCEFTSASRQVLSYHNATHKPVKDITCDVCGKEFYSKARMRAHMIIHNKDKAANMCKLCSIYLCNSEALQRHYSNVHSQDYICNVCGKRCKSRKALNNHQNVHSAAKYKCTLCSNVYKSGHILKEHLLKHEGIRKYKCNVCGKDFAQQSHLAAHMAVHSEKRFFCPGCKRAFNRHDNMKMHTKRCEIFLAKPELSTLLKIRKSRSKTAEESPKSPNLESSSPIANETSNTVENRDKPSTDGLFLKAQLVKTDS